MLPKGQNWILMLALLLAVPVMRSPITVPRSQSRDDRETRARLSGQIGYHHQWCIAPPDG
jgi:hypothetical protein